MFKSITVKLMTYASNVLRRWAGGLVTNWVPCHPPTNLENIQCERLLTKNKAPAMYFINMLSKQRITETQEAQG